METGRNSEKHFTTTNLERPVSGCPSLPLKQQNKHMRSKLKLQRSQSGLTGLSKASEHSSLTAQSFLELKLLLENRLNTKM